MFHLRFTPDDISGYTFKFLENFDRYIIAYEVKKKDGSPAPPHYHILIETDYGKKSITDALKADLKVPKTTRGKGNKYYSLMSNWEDPGYICKYGDIRGSKGYTPAEVLECVENGKKKYLRQVEETELSGEVAPAVLRKPKVVKVPFQQAVIAAAAADWYNYKRECQNDDDSIDKKKVIDFVVKAMRQEGKGINQYLVKEISLAVLYDDLDYRDRVLNKIKSDFYI